MTYQDYYDEALRNRGMALAAKRFAMDMQTTAKKKKNEIDTVLFGYDDNAGFLSVIQAYYRLIWLGLGRSTKTPVMTSYEAAEAQFASNLERSMLQAGDGAGGIHPPDPDTPSVGSDEINLDSVWLSGFSLETAASGQGIEQYLSAISNTAASDKSSFIAALTSLDTAVGEWAEQHIAIKNMASWAFTLSDFKAPFPVENGETLETLAEQAEGWRAEFRAYLNYFSSTGDTGAALESSAAALKSYALETLDAVRARCGAVPGLLADILKHFAHWVSEAAKKPDGPYAMLNMAGTLLQNSVQELKETDEALEFYETDRDKWMETPSSVLVYYSPVMNLDQVTVKAEKITVMWSPVASANQYKVLIRTLASFPDVLTDAQWETFDAVAVQNSDPDTGDLCSELSMEIPDKPIFVRVVALDSTDKMDVQAPLVGDPALIVGEFIVGKTPGGEEDDDAISWLEFDRMDTFNSSSRQSRMVGDEVPFAQLLPVDGVSVVSIGKEYKVKEMDYLLVNRTNIVRVASVSENEVQLDKDCGEIQSVQKLQGFFVPPSTPEAGS